MTDGVLTSRARCLVLLSTFNGHRFLAEQLATVLNQEAVDVRVHIRDDGSSDQTVDLIRQLAADDGRVTLETGHNVGPAQSYLRMLSQVTGEFDFVALCDQDDVWKAGKLARAISRITNIAGPAIYCSAVDVVDEQLRPLGIHRTSRRGPALENALVQNIATGCTIVLNRPSLALFRTVPAHPVMHDAWIYAAVAATGVVHYDPDTWVYYRQHQANSIGLAGSPTMQWVRRLRQHAAKGRDRVHTHQAQELLELFGQVATPSSRQVLSNFVTAQETTGGRIRYAFLGPAFRQRRVDSIIYRVLCALGRI